MKTYTPEEVQALDRATWSEETFQARLMAQLLGRGFQAVHFTPAYTGTVNKATGKARVRTPYTGSGKGFPDTVAIRLDPPLGIAWELKVGKNTATEAQLKWLRYFAAMGFNAAVVRPCDWDVMMEVIGG